MKERAINLADFIMDIVALLIGCFITLAGLTLSLPITLLIIIFNDDIEYDED